MSVTYAVGLGTTGGELEVITCMSSEWQSDRVRECRSSSLRSVMIPAQVHVLLARGFVHF